MAVLVVPTAPDGQSMWSQRTSLGGRDYVLTFRWSQRAGRWSVDVADQDGDMIAAGRVLVPSRRVLRGVRDTRLPAGDLVLIDQRSTREGLDDPTFTSLGERHVLAYVDGDDLDELVAVIS